MKKKKMRFLVCAFFLTLAAVKSWGYTYTVSVTCTRTIPCPSWVTGPMYKAADGTIVEVKGDSSDPSSYGGHGVPSRTETYTDYYEVTIDDAVFNNYVMNGLASTSVSYYWDVDELIDGYEYTPGFVTLTTIFRYGDEITGTFDARMRKIDEEEALSSGIQPPVLVQGGQYWDSEYSDVIDKAKKYLSNYGEEGQASVHCVKKAIAASIANYNEELKAGEDFWKPYADASVLTYAEVIQQRKIKDDLLKVYEDISLPVGDPVLMTSGQYRHEEVDVTMRAGVLEFQLGRYYQSGNEVSRALGLKWFSTLDSCVLLGTDEASELYYLEMVSQIHELDEELQTARKEHAAAIAGIDDDMKTCRAELADIEPALRNLENFNHKDSTINDAITRLKNTKAQLNEHIELLKTYRNNLTKAFDDADRNATAKLEEARTKSRDLKKYADLSAFCRQRNASASEGYGFDLGSWCGTGTAVLYDAYGRLKMFRIVTAPDYSNRENLYPDGALTVPMDGSAISLAMNLDGSWLYTDEDGFRWKYGVDGLLRSKEDSFGNVASIEYKDGKAVSLLRNGKTAYSLLWKDGKISAVVNKADAGDKVEFLYDGELLSGVKDCDGDIRRYGYLDGEDGLLTSIQKPDGTAIKIEYGYTIDGEKLVSRTCDENGFWETFSYSQNRRRVEHTDHSGMTTVYEYDDYLRTSKVTMADGTVMEYAYNQDGTLRSEVVGVRQTRFSYDASGRVTGKMYPDGSSESWSYDGRGNMVSWRSRTGVLKEYTYDAFGNITSSRTDGVKDYSFSWDGHGQLTESVMYRCDGTSYSQIFTYDEAGNLISRLSGDSDGTPGFTGNAEYELKEWTYDGRGRQTSVSANGKLLEQWVYEDRKTTVFYSNGLKIECLYNNRKDCVSRIETDTVTGSVRCFEMTYDSSHRPVRWTVSSGKGKPEDTVIEYRYYPAGEIEAELYIRNEMCAVKHYSHSAGMTGTAAMVTEERSFSCSIEELKAAGWTQVSGFSGVNLEKLWNVSRDRYLVGTTYEVTYAGTRITEKDSAGSARVTMIDNDGNLLSRTTGNQVDISFAYDAEGRVLESRNEYGGVTEYGYDSYGNLASMGAAGKNKYIVKGAPDGYSLEITGKDGSTAVYVYDDMNRLQKTVKAGGTVWYGYDWKGRVRYKGVGGNGTVSSALEYTTYDYSDDERSLTVVKGGLYTEVYELDAWGNTVEYKDGEGNSRRFEYDCNGRLVAEYDGYGSKTAYEYDCGDNLVKEVFPDGTVYEYAYDIRGNLTEKKFQGETVWTGLYDGMGNLVEAKARGKAAERFEYDGEGRITARYAGDVLKETLAYGADGRKVTLTDGRGAQSITEYDDFGNILLNRDRMGGVSEWLYDQGGYLSMVKSADGKTVSYKAGADGMGQTVLYSDGVHSAGTEDTVVYDFAGRVTELRNSNGSIFYEYDQGGNLIKETDAGTGETIVFRYDRAGQRICVSGAGRNITTVYGKNGEVLESRDYGRSMGVRLEYDVNMREVKRICDNGMTTSTSWRPDGAVESIVVKDRYGKTVSGRLYIYDAAGINTACADQDGNITLYEYDTENRLCRVLYPDVEEYRNYQQDIAATYSMAGSGISTSVSMSVSGELMDQVRKFVSLCSYGGKNLPVYRNFLVEKFSYDGNGNITTWELNGGKLEYTYDAEDMLTGIFADGRQVVSYEYDSDHNLLKVKNLLSGTGESAVYAYDAAGRLASSTVTDSSGSTGKVTYSYDALGRQTGVMSSGAGRSATVYDGLTAAPIVEYSENPYGGASYEQEQQSSVQTGERYRYIGDDSVSGSYGRAYGYGYGASGAGSSSVKAYSKASLLVNNETAAVETGGTSLYLSWGSADGVTCSSDSWGRVSGSYAYDVFGSLLSEAGTGAGNDSSSQVGSTSSGNAAGKTSGTRYNALTGMSTASGRREVIMDDIYGQPIMDFTEITRTKDENGKVHIDCKSVYSDRIKLEVHRSAVKNTFNNDVEYLKIGSQIVASFMGIQSEKSMNGDGQKKELAEQYGAGTNAYWREYENARWETDYSDASFPCGTLSTGVYSIKRLEQSGSYYYPMLITASGGECLAGYNVEGIKASWWFMVHSSSSKSEGEWGLSYKNGKAIDYEKFYETYSELCNESSAGYYYDKESKSWKTTFKNGYSLGCQVAPDVEHKRLIMMLDSLGVDVDESIKLVIKQKDSASSK